jgi:hypothetical protein
MNILPALSPGRTDFVSKPAAGVLAFLGLMLFSIPMSAQKFGGLLSNGNVYAGVSYGQLTNVVNTQSYRGWNGSFEDLPFSQHPKLGLVVDVSGFYRSTGVTQYNFVGGPRVSTNMGRWRPFFDAMAGIRHLDSSGFIYNPLLIDVGGGVDYKLGLRNFSWRLQADYMHTHYASASQNDYRASTGIVWRF